MITKKEIIKKLEENSGEIKKRKVKKIGLFGSFVKGREKRGSDIDLLVSFDNENYGKDYFELLFYLEDLFRRKIDLIPEGCLRKELNYVRKEAEFVVI